MFRWEKRFQALALSLLCSLVPASFLYAQDYFEPDNNYLQAQPIIIDGDSQIHNFDGGDTQDWVSAPLVAGNRYQRIVYNVGTSADVAVTTFLTDGVTPSGGTDTYWEGEDEGWISVITAPSTGTFFFQTSKIGGVGTDTHYQIKLIHVGIPTGVEDAYENDDTFGTASVLAPNVLPQHHNFQTDANDWFQIVVGAGDIGKSFVIQTLVHINVTDTVLELYRPDGTTLIVSNDDAGAPGTGSTRASQVDFIPTSPGTYYVRCRSFNNLVGNDRDYSITLATFNAPANSQMTVPTSAQVPVADGVLNLAAEYANASSYVITTKLDNTTAPVSIWWQKAGTTTGSLVYFAARYPDDDLNLHRAPTPTNITHTDYMDLVFEGAGTDTRDMILVPNSGSQTTLSATEDEGVEFYTDSAAIKQQFTLYWRDNTASTSYIWLGDGAINEGFNGTRSYSGGYWNVEVSFPISTLFPAAVTDGTSKKGFSFRIGDAVYEYPLVSFNSEQEVTNLPGYRGLPSTVVVGGGGTFNTFDVSRYYYELLMTGSAATPTATATATPTCIGAYTMGNTLIGASSGSGLAAFTSTRYSMSGPGTLMGFWMHLQSVGSPAPQAYIGLYTDSGGTQPNTLIAQSGPQTLATGWNHFDVAPTFIPTGGNYWIAFNIDDSAGAAAPSYNTSGPVGYVRNLAWGSLPNNAPNGGSGGTNYYSTYADLCAAPTPTPTRTATLTPTFTATATSTPCALIVSSGVTLLGPGTYNFCSVQITGTGQLSINGATTFIVSGNFTVDSTASIIGLARGHCAGGAGAPGCGPGAGGAGSGAVLPARGGGGGGHGGFGGQGGNLGGNGGISYDLSAFQEGSGGGGGSTGAFGASGGSALWVQATGNATLNGTLNFNGGSGTPASGTDAGGGGAGAGGSIRIEAFNISGTTGNLSTNGGLGGNGTGSLSGYGGGGGGGGRIYLCASNTYSYTGIASANLGAGGSGNTAPGGNGSMGTVVVCGAVTPTPTFTATSSATPTRTSTATVTPTATCSTPSQFGNGHQGDFRWVSSPSINSSKFQMGQSGLVSALRLNVTATGGGGQIRCAIYDDAGGNPGNLVAETVVMTSAVGWNNLPLTVPTLLVPGTYWLAWQGEPGVEVAHDIGGSGDEAFRGGFTFGAFPAGYNETAMGSFLLSIFAVYCPTAGASPTPTNTPACFETAFGNSLSVGGGSYWASDANSVNSSRYVLSTSGWLTKMYVRRNSTAGAVRLAVYSDNGGAPQSLLVESTPVAGLSGWVEADVPDTYLSGGVTYWLAWQGEFGAAVEYQTGINGDEAFRTPYPYAAFPAAFAPTGTGDFRWAIVGFVCPGVAPTATSTPTRTSSPTATATRTSTFTSTSTPTSTFTSSGTWTSTSTASTTPTPTSSATLTATPSASPTTTATSTFTFTNTATPVAPQCGQSDNFNDGVFAGFWGALDINTGLAGSQNETTSLQITADGLSFGGSWFDSTRFIYQPVSGDYDVSLKIDYAPSTTNYSTVGLMFRDTKDPDSRFVYVGVENQCCWTGIARPIGGVPDQNESFVGGYSNSGPTWVRLARTGSNFAMSYSTDGISWNLIDNFNVTLNNTYLIGIAASSDIVGVLDTASVDDFTVLSGAVCSMTPTPSSTSTATSTPTSTPTSSSTSSATSTSTHTPTPTATQTSSSTFTATSTSTFSWTPTPTSTSSFTFTATASSTPTSTATSSASSTPTPTPTSTTTSTSSSSPTPTPTRTNTLVSTPTSTSTLVSTQTSTATSTSTFTFTATASSSPTPTPTSTATSTSTASPSPTPTSTNTLVSTATSTSTASTTPTPTSSATLTATPSASPTATATATPTRTNTLVSTATSTSTLVSTQTSTATSSASPTPSPTPTSTLTATPTASMSPTATLTASRTLTSTATFTASPTPSSTPTATPSATTTSSPTPTRTLTQSPTPTSSRTATPTATLTNSPTPSSTRTPSSTPTSTFTRTATSTPGSFTPTATPDVLLVLGSNSFDPGIGPLTLGIQTRQAGRVKVSVYNVAGELVETLFDQPMAVGSGPLTWGGLNSAGVLVGNGVYFILIETPGGKEIKKVIVLK